MDDDKSGQRDGEVSEEGFVFVFDRREKNGKSVKLSLGGLFGFQEFRGKVREEIGITDENFVIVTTNRLKIANNQSYEELVEVGDTLYILRHLDQDLIQPVQEFIEYIPHYDTLVKSGMYEYYESAGQNPLCFAIAELIDNALTATAANEGPREIKVTIYFDNPSCASAVCVSDNGSGMTSKDLNNWAVYRLSRFNRIVKPGKTSQLSPFIKDLPRSLNSDIGYFGVGGKQAIFFIGSSTTVITKKKHSKDVHEMTLSKQDFERKEKRKEPVYSGYINNRQIGNSSHVPSCNKVLKELIATEPRDGSFTHVFISDIDPKQAMFLKQNFAYLCRQLAHIYHYYLHGPMGNIKNKVVGMRLESPFRQMDIAVIVKDKGVVTHQVSLRDIDNDLESLFLKSTQSLFEFNAHVEGVGKVEGVLRYHPFLYDRETFPDVQGIDSAVPIDEATSDTQFSDIRGPRGDKPIFECFWNGRLIPYTTIEWLEWCAPPKKKTNIPQECFYRISGALFTDDSFQVSTNKLTFIDLEGKLKEKTTIFSKIVMGQEQRTIIGRAFNEWVKSCHETCDKQIKFLGFMGTVNRKDVAQKRNQGVWSTYKAIEWDGRIFKVGQLIRTARTLPIIVGKISKFYLYGDHNGEDIFATGGEIEIVQEPESLYGDIKVLPLEKLDRSPSEDDLKEFIQNEELKLPATLLIKWQNGNKLVENSKIAAGSKIGPFKVDILNGKDESINKLPGERMKKLLLELRIVSYCGNSEQKTLLQLTCQHGGKKWAYWFRKIENITDIGRHSLQLRTIVSDANTSAPMKSLPGLDIPFTVIEADPDKLTVGLLETPLKVGMPFQMEFADMPFPSIPVTRDLGLCTGLNFKFNGVIYRGNSLIVRDVTAEGAISSTGGKDFVVQISFPKLKNLSQTIPLRLLPGPPSKLEVLQRTIEIENGEAFTFDVEIKDKAGNITSQPKLEVICKISCIPNFETVTCDCSSTGKGALVSQPVNVKNINREKVITATLELQHYKGVKPVDRAILVKPSTRASKIEVFYTPSGASDKVPIKAGQDIQCVAGETITGLYFVIYDEGNNQLDVNQCLASKLKVNWAAKISKEELKLGRLPDIQALTTTDDFKYCQVTCTDGNEDAVHTFSLRATHAEPSTLKLSCENTEFRMSEPVSSEITAKLNDDYGNFISVGSDDLEFLSVSGDGLKIHRVTKIVHKNGVPGPRVLCIQWKHVLSYQKLEMLPGPAADLVLVDFDNREPVEVRNGNAFPKSIRIQLIDAAGNETKEKNVRCILQRDPHLKLSPPPPQQRTDSNGQAVFDNFTVRAPRGMYQIMPRAILASGNRDGPLILVSVEPDPTKPVKLETVWGEQRVFTTGELLPDMEAYVLNEDETPVATIKGKDLVLKLWHNPTKKNADPPEDAASYAASAGKRTDPNYHFYFRDIKVPERAGQYCLIVEYENKGSVPLLSQQITFTVIPGKPVRLVPVTVPPTPTASNNSRSASRQLVKNLRFELKDQFGNVTGFDLHGTIKVNVIGGSSGKKPRLQGGSKGISFSISKGSAIVQQLMLEANTIGVDGQEYVLLFEAVISGSETLEIEPFKLSFLFYDDVHKQAKMAQLTKERDRLTKKISTHRALLDTRAQLLKEKKDALREAKMHDQSIRRELIATGYKDGASLDTKNDISLAIETLRQFKSRLEMQPKRQCHLSVGRKDKDIVGKIGHLALIHDDDIARVLSWHMASDMDCIVTITTEQAKVVHSLSNGRQQVLPLDSIYRKGLPDWKKPLPHVRFPGIRSLGAIHYARDFLIFPEHEDKCKMIFGMLLGDTIIAENLDIATKYRQEVVKFTYCPTILTRTGERIRSNGKFGGLQNKAPPLDRMGGAVFSCPLPPVYRTICNQIDLLSNLETAAIRIGQLNAELQVQLAECKSKSTEDAYFECLGVEKELHQIENQLKLTSRVESLPPSMAQFFAIQPSKENENANRRKRTSNMNSGEDHAPIKRANSSCTEQVNHNTVSNGGRTRSSGRKRRK